MSFWCFCPSIELPLWSESQSRLSLHSTGKRQGNQKPNRHQKQNLKNKRQTNIHANTVRSRQQNFLVHAVGDRTHQNMYTRSQKHSPQREVAPALQREVEFPKRVSKKQVESQFSFGKPAERDVHLNTTSRASYTNQSATPESRADILRTKAAIGEVNRSRNFFLGASAPYISESRDKLVAPPSAIYAGEVVPSIQNKKTAAQMNTASFLVNTVNSSPHTSTLRHDFKICDVGTMHSLRSEAALCRAEQQRTNYSLGDRPTEWRSESRAAYGAGARKQSGLLPELRRSSAATPEITSKHTRTNNSQFTLGGSDLAEKGVARTMVQQDYIPHRVETSLSRPHQVDAQKDCFQFGHRGVAMNSLYRESFTPTVYSKSSPTGPIA